MVRLTEFGEIADSSLTNLKRGYLFLIDADSLSLRNTLIFLELSNL